MMYATSKRKNTKGWHDDESSWDWDAMGSGDKDEPAKPAPRPTTSLSDLDRASQTSRTLSSDGQKRPDGGFYMPAYGSQAKRIKVEHTSPGPAIFRARSTPDAKPAIERAKTPAAPKKRPAGPFIIDDSDEESDNDTTAASTAAAATAAKPASSVPAALTSVTIPESQHTTISQLRLAARNSMPASREEQKAESRRLREEALARRYGSSAVSVKVARPSNRPPPQPFTPISNAEPIDLTDDTPSPPAFNGRQSSRTAPERFETVLPKIPRDVKSEELRTVAPKTPKAVTPGESNTVAPRNESTAHGSVEDRPRQQVQEWEVSKTVAEGTPQIDGHPFQAVDSKVLRAALQPPNAATVPKPQEVLRIPVTSKKPTAFDELRAQLRQSELKREGELKKQEAARTAALTRNEIADRRRAEQEQQRKQRLVEDARKKAAARQQAIDQAQREADRRRQLEKEVEQPVAQLEKERKKQLEEQHRIFMEKRKAEKDAQERLRQQQLERHKAAERAQQQKIREERTPKLQERNAQQAITQNSMTEVQQAALPAPVSLSQMAKDAARAGGATNTNDALDSSPSMQPRSLHSLRTGELSRLEASAKQDAGPLGEITEVDLKLVQMRNVQNLDWADIAHYHESATSHAKFEDILRRRYRTVENALKQHNLPVELVKRARDGDGAARAEINQRVNGQEPIPRGSGGTKPRAESQPVLRLGHQRAAPVSADTARLEALPNAASPYRNFFVNSAGRRDGATEGRQNVGGKTIDENFFFHMLEQNHRAFVEMDEESEPEDAPEDRFYYTYSLKRRELPDGSDPDNTDAWPVTRSDETFETLQEANSAASREIYRLSDYEGLPFPNITAGHNLAHAVDSETGMMSYELQTDDGGTVQVDVQRELHARRDQAQRLPPATISRTVYHVMQRTTTKEVVDAVLGTEKETVKESMVSNTSHTDRDQANEIAIHRYVHANYRFDGGAPNLSKRTEVCKPRIEALKDSLLVGQLFRSDPGEAQVEVWVQEGKVAGPRN